jgi:hypothetical protein
MAASLFTYGLGDFTLVQYQEPVRHGFRSGRKSNGHLPLRAALKNLTVRFDLPGENERNPPVQGYGAAGRNPAYRAVAFDTYLDINRVNTSSPPETSMDEEILAYTNAN